MRRMLWCQAACVTGLWVTCTLLACRNDTSAPQAREQPAAADADPDRAGAASNAPGPDKNPLGGCATCHVDSVDAFTTSEHQAAGMTCQDCHGASLAHIDDENNQVKPDRTFTRQSIDPFCGKCHACSRPALTTMGTSQPGTGKTCTECHGAHEVTQTAK